MKPILLSIVTFLSAFIFLISCNDNKKYSPRNVVLKEIKTFEFNNNINAITYSDNVVAFAGDNGLFGMIDLNTFAVNSSQQKHKDFFPNFHSVAFTDSNFFMISYPHPIIIYKTGKKEMELVFEDDEDLVSDNHFAFLDNKTGIVIGNKFDDYFSILKTTDGGYTWHKVTENFPPADPDEAISNISSSALVAVGNKFYFVTQGKFSHIYIYNKNVERQEKYKLPIQHGKNYQGAYSTDFYSEEQGVVAGGNPDDKNDSQDNLLLTFDGGKSWESITNNIGKIHCIKYIPNTMGNELILNSQSGIWFSSDKGYTWKKISDEIFYYIACIDTNKIALSNTNKIKIIELFSVK